MRGTSGANRTRPLSSIRLLKTHRPVPRPIRVTSPPFPLSYCLSLPAFSLCHRSTSPPVPLSIRWSGGTHGGVKCRQLLPPCPAATLPHRCHLTPCPPLALYPPTCSSSLASFHLTPCPPLVLSQPDRFFALPSFHLTPCPPLHKMERGDAKRHFDDGVDRGEVDIQVCDGTRDTCCANWRGRCGKMRLPASGGFGKCSATGAAWGSSFGGKQSSAGSSWISIALD